jgi:hypothetical protein
MDEGLAEKTSRRQIYIEAGALIEDPTALPDLVARVGRDALPVSGIPFDTKQTIGRKVDCALCGRMANHYRGFVVTFENDSRAIIGKDCGERDLFDQGAWKAMEVAADRRQRQALYTARSAPTIEAVERLLPLLDLCEATLVVLTAFLARVSNELPELYQAVTGAYGKGGELVLYNPNRRLYVTIPTFAPFKREAFGGLLARVRQGLQRACKMLDQQEGITLAEQEEAFRLIRESERHFQNVHANANAASAFATQAFWKGVAKWVNAGFYEVDLYQVSRTVIRCDDEDDPDEVPLPDPAAYTMNPFEAVRAAWPRL